MGFIGGEVGYRLLRRFAPRHQAHRQESSYRQASKLESLLGATIWEELLDKRVLDFGCGTGEQVIELVQHGARHGYGLDVREEVLAIGRRRAEEAGISHYCITFSSRPPEEPVDAIISLDAFEHFDDPGSVLSSMHALLRPGGQVHISFGPTWYHPYGGHLFSVFPFAHLLFTEQCLIRWRSDFKSDGATRFSEVAGGLNRMTVSRFERLVRRSPLRCETLEAVPIRKLQPLARRWSREFTTAIVRARLVRPAVDCRPANVKA